MTANETARDLIRKREAANGPLTGLATTAQAEGVKGYAQSARASIAAARAAEQALTGSNETDDALAFEVAALLSAAENFTAAGAQYLAAVGPAPKWRITGTPLDDALHDAGATRKGPR
jgi:hypothetical protein